jgi:hypothetical protein
MAEDATPLVEALLEISRGAGLLAAGWVRQGRVYHQVLEAIDNPKIIAALAAHGHPVAG